MLNNSWWPAAWFGIALLASLAAAEETSPRVATRANAKLEDTQVFTVAGIGAGQGVSMHEGRLYFYGDVGGDERRAGLIRVFRRDMRASCAHVFNVYNWKNITGVNALSKRD